jgi:hypothetical protein
MDVDDEFGPADHDEFMREVIQVLPQRLRERSCPAGEPWTGDHPEEEHGHTDCWYHHLAATEIERLRAELSEAARTGYRHASQEKGYTIEYLRGEITRLTSTIERARDIPWAPNEPQADLMRAILDEIDSEEETV